MAERVPPTVAREAFLAALDTVHEIAGLITARLPDLHTLRDQARAEAIGNAGTAATERTATIAFIRRRADAERDPATGKLTELGIEFAALARAIDACDQHLPHDTPPPDEARFANDGSD